MLNILLFIQAFSCDEFKARCDERCSYEYTKEIKGTIVNGKCKCLVDMDLASEPPIKITPNLAPEKKKIYSVYSE